MEEKRGLIIEDEKSAKHLNMLFSFFREKEQICFYGAKTHFSSTEICLIGEVLSARYQGRRLISTRLADILGITRSAVSQIVNRLEAQNVVRRVADDVDRKIAYVEITEEALETYGEDLEICVDFVGRVVEKFGEERFNNMCKAFEDFCALVELEKADFVKKRKYTK